MTVIALHLRPDLIPDAATLMVQTWPDHYGPDGPGDAPMDLQNRCRADGLPYGFLAVQDDNVVGLGALDATSCGSRPEETVWLVGLCVAPSHRGQRIGSQIVKAATACAKEQGHNATFATTQNAIGLLTRAGWQDLRGHQDTAGAWRILRLSI